MVRRDWRVRQTQLSIGLQTTFSPSKEGRNVKRILAKKSTPQTEGMEEEAFWGGRL
jgi:hypothetical protein